MELSFGEQLKALREDADLTQAALGKALGMTQRRVSYLECGKYEPSLEDIRAICGYFQVSADELLGIRRWDSKAGKPHRSAH